MKKIFLFFIVIFTLPVYNQQQEWTIKTDEPLGSFMVQQPGFNGKSIVKPVFESISDAIRLQIKQLESPISIDGILDDEAWKYGELINSFIDNESNKKVSDSTNIRLLYDEKRIYIGITCNKSKIKDVVNIRSQHDSPVMLDDHIGIYITPQKQENEAHFYDGYYYYIAINSSGTVFDAFYNPWHGGIFYPNWNPDISLKTSQNRDYWIVELAIEFKGLEYYVSAGREYLLNFTRKQFGRKKSIYSIASKGVIVKNTYESMVAWRVPFYDNRSMPLSEYLPDGVKFKHPEITLKKAIKNDKNEIDWSMAPSIDNLVRHDTGELPEQRTSVKLAYDNHNLYARFICFESLMNELSAKNKEHDWPGWNEWGSYRSPKKYNVVDDAVGLYLSPSFDENDQYHHPTYLIMVNVNGVTYDAFFDEFGIFHKSWNSEVKSNIYKAKDHWIAEITIPFGSFDVNPENPEKWGINLIRRRPEKSDTGPVKVKKWRMGKRKVDMDVEYAGGYEITCWSPTYGHIRNPIRMGVINGLELDYLVQVKTYLLAEIPFLEKQMQSIKSSSKYQKKLVRLLADFNDLKTKIHHLTLKDVTIIYNKFHAIRKKIRTWHEWIHTRRIKQVSATERRLTDVHFVDEHNGWVVGSAGVILHTGDGGTTWEVQKSGTDYELEGVFFVDSLNGWAVGGNIRPPRKENFIDRDVGAMGIILHTTDAGKTWLPQVMGDARWLYDVTFIDKDMGWAVGAFGLVLATDNGGETWQVQLTGSLKWLNEVCFTNKNHGWIACEDEQVLITTDAGKHWEKITTPEHQDTNDWPGVLNSIYFIDKKTGWTAGRNGNLFKTIDGGKTWNFQILPCKKGIKELVEFQDVHFINKNKGWALSYLGDIIFHTEDAGKTWQVCHTGNRNWLHALCFVDNKNGWAVGERGTILKTTDSGLSWQKQRSDGSELDILVFHAHSDDELPIVHLTTYYADQGYKVGYIRYTRNDLSTYRLGELRTQEFRATSAYSGGVLNRTINQCMNAGRQGFPMPYLYKKWGGWEPSERWMVATIRTLRPKVIITQELAFDKVSHSVGGYMVMNSIEAAGNPAKYPLLQEIGLSTWKTPKVYLMVWPYLFENSYNPWPATLDFSAILDEVSPRLNCKYIDIEMHAFTRCQSQGGYEGYFRVDWRAPCALHLYKSNVNLMKSDNSIFDGIVF